MQLRAITQIRVECNQFRFFDLHQPVLLPFDEEGDAVDDDDDERNMKGENWAPPNLLHLVFSMSVAAKMQF